MLAYTADRRPAGPSVSPRTLVLVVAGHAALLGLVMTARGDLPLPRQFDPTQVIFVDPIKPPPPEPQPQPQPKRDPVRSVIARPTAIAPLPLPTPVPLDTSPHPALPPTPFVGTGDAVPQPQPPIPGVGRKAPRFATPPDSVRPPYPEEKRRLEQEADLHLSLRIDPRGRVVAVDPVGPADPVFLAAARRHILRAWRYQPAMEGGQPVASRVTITLSFRLDE